MKTEENRGGTIFVSVLLSILMFVLVCIFIALLMARAGNASVIIQHVEISELIEDTDIAYYIVHALNGLPFNDTEIDLHDVEDFIRSDAVSNEIGNVADKYARALSGGDMDYFLTSGEILDIVQNLEPEFSELFDHTMTDADNERMARVIDDIMGFEGLSVGGLLEDFDVAPTVPFLIFSPYLLLFIGVLCFAVLFMMYWINRHRISNVFVYGGVPVLFAGLMFFIAGYVLGNRPHMLGDAVLRFTRFTGGVVVLLTRYGIGFAIGGFVFILLSFFIRPKVYKGKRVMHH